MSMFKKMQQAIVALSAKGQQVEAAKDIRQGTALLAGLVMKPAEIAERLAGLQRTADLHAEETGSWISAKDVEAGKPGPFDACDLRHWLVLAEFAGVPYIPAKEILDLTEDEMSMASGIADIPDNPVTRGIRKRMADIPEFKAAAEDLTRQTERREAEAEQADSADKGPSLLDRLYLAMDDVPEGWMVRSARCGSDELKALAGSGLAGPESPEVKFGPDLEVGPGWVRNTNRRRVHVSDHRTVQAAAQGPGGAAFLARPWMKAARYVVTEDPHRHGSVYAGKGLWPSEWRAFVEKGKVVGVAYYYAWAGEATPENAAIALEVRDLAQRIADEATRRRAWPRFADIELMRLGGNEKLLADPRVKAALELFDRESVACTLDFLEVEDQGLMLLEGGPPNTPFGGGHPCAFAGVGGLPKFGNKTLTQGVAFNLMDGVLLGDRSTWNDGDHAGHILDWDAVAELAASAPSP